MDQVKNNPLGPSAERLRAIRVARTLWVKRLIAVDGRSIPLYDRGSQQGQSVWGFIQAAIVKNESHLKEEKSSGETEAWLLRQALLIAEKSPEASKPIKRAAVQISLKTIWLIDDVQNKKDNNSARWQVASGSYHSLSQVIYQSLSIAELRTLARDPPRGASNASKELSTRIFNDCVATLLPVADKLLSNLENLTKCLAKNTKMFNPVIPSTWLDMRATLCDPLTQADVPQEAADTQRSWMTELPKLNIAFDALEVAFNSANRPSWIWNS
ncbi:hypothetical protein FRB90_000794 [Tulasnella sp. 427]|nr:hypothetical protein FRB90_000794 [Tulasnella sp. 427]